VICSKKAEWETVHIHCLPYHISGYFMLFLFTCYVFYILNNLITPPHTFYDWFATFCIRPKPLHFAAHVGLQHRLFEVHLEILTPTSIRRVLQLNRRLICFCRLRWKVNFTICRVIMQKNERGNSVWTVWQKTERPSKDKELASSIMYFDPRELHSSKDSILWRYTDPFYIRLVLFCFYILFIQVFYMSFVKKSVFCT